MSDRAVSFEHLLGLAHLRALDGKGGLAASVAKMCLESRSDLTERELSLTFEILRMLIDKVEVEVRRNISDYLAERDDVPKDLISFLANDTVHVAYPILRGSKLLTDLDLIHLISDHGHGHALVIATRSELSKPVSSTLIAMNDDQIDTTLAKNLTARISHEDLSLLVDRSVDNAGLRAPLTHRGDLGTDLARNLYTVVGEALRRHIVENYDIDEALVFDTIDMAVQDSLDHPAPLTRAMGTDWADLSARAGTASAARLLTRLIREGLDGAALAFAEQTRLPLEIASWLFHRADPQTLAVAMKAIGMDVDGFTAVLDRLKRGTDSEEIDRLIAYFDRIDGKTATMVVNHWKTRAPDFHDS
ncbi:MAG: DUF2336 domain-containing protein [Alphaproteobacteria bacterium]|nr:DUF2336 domain-containing protein [Alphaproteobacteria bacterium]